MEKVTGIGGVFFTAEAPSELSAWYERHLGVSSVPSSYDELPWEQQAVPTVFAPFESETDYFGPSSQSWMVNFRVSDLNA